MGLGTIRLDSNVQLLLTWTETASGCLLKSNTTATQLVWCKTSSKVVVVTANLGLLEHAQRTHVTPAMGGRLA